MTAYIYLVIAIIGEVVGTTAMKASDGFTKTVPSAVTVLGYIVAFYFLSQVLKTIPVGIAYAVWAGLGIVLISIASWLLYGQKLDFAALSGMGLIVSGVLVINLFSASTGH